MYTYALFRVAVKFFILLFCTIFFSCALISKPDSCDLEELCKLEEVQTAEVTELKVGEYKNVSVCACRPWNESGIQVAEGQQYSFKAEIISDWIDGKVLSDPFEGWLGGFYKTVGFLSGYLKRSDKTSWYALVGSVGMDDANTFAVIKSEDGRVPMNKSGKLYFFANDMEGRYFNNKGKIILQVIREK